MAVLDMTPSFRALGQSVVGPSRDIETFPAPSTVALITMECDEVTSCCPITGQPDYYTVAITYTPCGMCLESKSLKRYLWTFRDVGIFCEALAAQILADVIAVCHPASCEVSVAQKRRGGITIRAVARSEQR